MSSRPVKIFILAFSVLFSSIFSINPALAGEFRNLKDVKFHYAIKDDYLTLICKYNDLYVNWVDALQDDSLELDQYWSNVDMYNSQLITQNNKIIKFLDTKKNKFPKKARKTVSDFSKFLSNENRLLKLALKTDSLEDYERYVIEVDNNEMGAKYSSTIRSALKLPSGGC
jgi:hypothetical protein